MSTTRFWKFATLLVDWGDGSTTDAALSTGNDGAAEAIACALKD